MFKLTTIYFILKRALAQQLHNEVRPALDAAGVQLLLTSIGTKERGLEFCERTGFDPARLLADPDNKIYDVLGMKRGLTETFFSPETPKAIWEVRTLSAGGY